MQRHLSPRTNCFFYSSYLAKFPENNRRQPRKQAKIVNSKSISSLHNANAAALGYTTKECPLRHFTMQQTHAWKVCSIYFGQNLLLINEHYDNRMLETECYDQQMNIILTQM